MRMRSLLKTGNPIAMRGRFGKRLAYARPTRIAKTPGQQGIVRMAEVVRDAPESASQAVAGMGVLSGLGADAPPPDWLSTLQTTVGTGVNLYAQQQQAKAAQAAAASAAAQARAAQDAVAAQMRAAQAGAALRPASAGIPWTPIVAVGGALLLLGGFFLLRKKG